MAYIKAAVGYHEPSNRRYFTVFTIADEVPEVEEEYENCEVTDVCETTLDCEQDNDKVYMYDYYRIEARDEDGDFRIFNIAVRNEYDPGV